MIRFSARALTYFWYYKKRHLFKIFQNCPSREATRAIWKILKTQVQLILNSTWPHVITYTKQNRGGAHKPDGTLNGMRALNWIITVICIFIILYIIGSIIIVNYYYHHCHHRYYFLYHDHDFIQVLSDSSYPVWAKAAKVSKQPPLICKHVYFVQWAKYKDLYGNEKLPSQAKNLN